MFTPLLAASQIWRTPQRSNESDEQYRNRFPDKIRPTYVRWHPSFIEEDLQHQVVLHKTDAVAFSFNTYREADPIEDPFGVQRGARNVLSVSAMLLDADCCDVGDLERVQAHFDRLGVDYCIYTSFSHRNPEKLHTNSGKRGTFDCFRVILPFDEPLDVETYSGVAARVWGHEVPDLGYTDGRGWDTKTTRNYACLWWGPSCLPELEPHARLEYRIGGRRLDVQSILKRPLARGQVIHRGRPQALTQPLPETLAEMDEVARALGDAFVSESGGKWRFFCPACQPDHSVTTPSLTIQPSGDGFAVSCFHAGCSGQAARRHIQDMGLHLPRPSRSVLEEMEDERRAALEVRDSLQSNVPQQEPLPVDAAAARLRDDLRAAFDAQDLSWGSYGQYESFTYPEDFGAALLVTPRPMPRMCTVLQYPCGVGKTSAAVEVISELISRGEQVVYTAPDHQLLDQTFRRLPPSIQARAIHLRSPLVPVGQRPVCARRAELEQRVLSYGEELYRICQKCELRTDCGARSEADADQKRLTTADLIFVSHQAVGRVSNSDNGSMFRYVVDEFPETHMVLRLRRDDIARLAAEPPKVITPGYGLAIQALAADIQNGCEGPLPSTRLEVFERAKFRATPRRDFTPEQLAQRTHADVKHLDRADVLVRALGAHHGVLQSDWRSGVEVRIETDIYQTCLNQRCVVLSATPTMEALPHAEVVTCEVQDASAHTQRRVLAMSGHSKTALEAAVWGRHPKSIPAAERIAEVMKGSMLKVSRAIYWARGIRDEMKPGAKILVVTFKSIVEAARIRAEKLDGIEDLEFAWFGAVRGLNHWERGAARECPVSLTVGDPWLGALEEVQSLGLEGDHFDAVAYMKAAAELYQAHERLRTARWGDDGVVQLHVGRVVPLGWHEKNTRLVTREDWPDQAAAILLRLRQEHETWEDFLGALARIGLPCDTSNLRKILSGQVPAPKDWLPKLIVRG